MNKYFEDNWKEFMKGRLSENPPETLDRYELARLFHKLGFMDFALKSSNKK